MNDKTPVRAGLLLLVALVPLLASAANASSQEDDWRNDWAVVDPFAVEIDSEGFSMPTAIAFVPEPGPEPSDPLYFVTELRGSVKVVTNNRTVMDFAEVPAFETEDQFPLSTAEAGLAGICLDATNGYVFVTFATRGADGLLRNNLVRFDSTPGSFTGGHSGAKVLAPQLAEEHTSSSHQIGGCVVQDNSLFVGVGDGGDPRSALNVDRLLGKIVRLTLNGEPHPDNPFRSDGAEGAAQSVWSFGLRNPFGLTTTAGSLFVLDNGVSVDRFLRIEKGANYLWDGRDESIAAAADVVFVESLGPVQLDRYPDGSALFPVDFRQGFYFATSTEDTGKAGIFMLPFDVSTNRALGPAEQLVSYQGSDYPAVTGAAFGPDGLYFAPLLPGQVGVSPILKLVYGDGGGYPTRLEVGQGGLVAQYGCVGCHDLGQGGGTVGPSLHFSVARVRVHLEERLHSEAYRMRLAELDSLEIEPFVASRDARREVLESEGLDQIRAYVINKILEPRFDNPDAQMPRLGVSPQDAARLADEIVGTTDTGRGLGRTIRDLLPFPESRAGDMAAGLALGTVFWLAGMLAVGGYWLYRRRKNRLLQSPSSLGQSG